MQIGFIGLGHLGKTIANRLIESGHHLVVWNRTKQKAEGMDATFVNSPAELIQKVDLLFLCLFDSHAVDDVFNKPEGLCSTNLSGKVIVDLTTNHFDEVLHFHKLCESSGAEYLESPVLGSVVPASKGQLTILVSGKEAVFNQVKPILECIGSHLFFLGDPGLACKMKVVNNLTLGSFMATLAEATVLGEKIGLKRKEVLDILDAGGGKSMMLFAKRAKLENEDFSPHFSCGLIYKDLNCLQDLAYQLKSPLFTGAVVKELYAQTFLNKIDQEDLSAIYKIYSK